MIKNQIVEDDHSQNKQHISFQDFKEYCQKIVHLLNDSEIVQKQNCMNSSFISRQILSYKASYKIFNKMFAKQHDCEYLQIEQTLKLKSFEDKNVQKVILLKINFTYSLAYQIPLLLFMPYLVQNLRQNSDQQLDQQIIGPQLKPFKKQQISQILNLDLCSDKLLPSKQETGVFIVQNQINKQYFYSLHHCHIDTQGLDVKSLIPYYLALIGCHPELIVQK